MKTSPLQSWQNFWSQISTLWLPLTLASSPPLLGVLVCSSGKWEWQQDSHKVFWRLNRKHVCMVSGPELLLIKHLLFCYYYHYQVGQDKWYTGVNRGWGWRAGNSELRMSTGSLGFQTDSLGRGYYCRVPLRLHGRWTIFRLQNRSSMTKTMESVLCFCPWDRKKKPF